MHHLVTGAAGFIGSHLVDCLLAEGNQVSGIDDLSLGRLQHLDAARKCESFLFLERDISRLDYATECLSEAAAWGGIPDVIWHLAANSDIAAGAEEPGLDFRRTLQTTFAIIEAARATGVRKIAFASTSAVYGEHDGMLAENSGPLLPISYYGATKLASEALLSAAAEAFLERLWIFRFPNVVGSRATHGAIFDFISLLTTQPSALRVLGDGTQTKQYVHVCELIEAMRFILENARERRNLFNIGPQGAGTSVAFIAEKVVANMRPGTPIAYTGGDRGWVGDVPQFHYSVDRLTRLGWQPRLSSDAAVLRAIAELSIAPVQ
jgi:UDP-glucose 4-epimerase